MRINTSEPVPDDEEDEDEAVPENRLTFGSVAEGFQLFKTVFDFLKDMDPSGYGHGN